MSFLGSAAKFAFPVMALGGQLGGGNFLKELLMGKPGGDRQTQRFTPGQQQGLDQILQQALQGLQGNQFDFAPIEQQARSGFAQKTIPSITERFTSMGEGGQGSSAFQGALGRAGAGLEENIAGMKQQYGLQQQGQLQNLLSMGMTPQFKTSYMQSQPGMLQQGAQMLPQLIKLLGFL